MDLEDFAFLRSDAGQKLLQELAEIPITPHNHLQLAMMLRQTVTPAQANAVLETALLRQLAAAIPCRRRLLCLEQVDLQ